MKSLFSWMLLGTGPGAIGVQEGQRESRVQGMRQAPFMIDEPLCIKPLAGGSPVRALPYPAPEPLASGQTPLMMTPHSHFLMAPQVYLCYYLRVVLSEF